MTSLDILKKALGLDVQFDYPSFDKDEPPSAAQAILLVGLAMCERLEDIGRLVVNELEDIKSEIGDVESELSSIENQIERLVKSWNES